MYWLGSESHNIFKKSVRILIRQPKQIFVKYKEIPKNIYWRGSESHSIFEQKIKCFTDRKRDTLVISK